MQIKFSAEPAGDAVAYLAYEGDKGVEFAADLDKPAEAASALKFFAWAYKNGDKMAEDLEYVPMPAVVKAQVEKAWGEIKDTAGKPVAFK